MQKQLSNLLKVGLLFLCFASQVMAATTCFSTGTAFWNSNKWSQPACKTSGPPAGSAVVITNATAVTVNSNTSIVRNLTINAGGTLLGAVGNILTLNFNFTNNGTFTANSGIVSFNGIAQTITGNVTFDNLRLGASTVLTLAGNVRVTNTLKNNQKADRAKEKSI